MAHAPKCRKQNDQLLKDNIRENLGDLGFGTEFLDTKAKT